MQYWHIYCYLKYEIHIGMELAEITLGMERQCLKII
jgi:hypothetical protein